MAVYTSVAQLVGNTPLLELANYGKLQGLKAKILVKLEYFNPAGSVKDRVAKAMIEDAEKSGKLKRGGIIIEPTSGNTGIGLAAIGCAKGYKVILTMPETMSVERRNMIKAYGAEIVLHAAFSPEGAAAFAQRLTELSAGQLEMLPAGEEYPPGPREN